MMCMIVPLNEEKSLFKERVIEKSFKTISIIEEDE